MAMVFALLLSQLGYAAEGYALLNGFWLCQEEGEQSTLEFKSRTELIFNGQPASYQLLPNAIQVIEASGHVNYYYEYLEGTLIQRWALDYPRNLTPGYHKADLSQRKQHKLSLPSSLPYILFLKPLN
jgi:hypothetical protein